NAGHCARICISLFGRNDSRARLKPVKRKIVAGIGEARARFARARALVAFGITLPGDLDELADLALGHVECRIIESRFETFGKYFLAESDIRHSRHDPGSAHSQLPSACSGLSRRLAQ